jgi:hypothetical protein
MTMRFTFTANAAAVIAAMALLILGSTVGHAGPAPGSAQYNLQQQQQQALNNLAQEFQQLRSAAGNDPVSLDLLFYQYLSDAYRIKQYYLSQDTRGQMIDKTVKNSGGGIENTGSAPKDVRSDVDLNAKTPEAAQNAINDWQVDNHLLKGPDGQALTPIDWNDPPYKVVDATTDTTLWLPCKTQACLDAKALDPDAWTTEGGLQGTGNSGRVRDPYGYYLDNEKKFAHAQDSLENLMNGGTSDMTFDDALKTVAKSLDKAAGQAGIKDNSELWAQAEALRNYGDPVEAGIADPGDSPDVVAQKLQTWLQNAESQMLQAKGVLKAAGDTTAAARQAAHNGRTRQFRAWRHRQSTAARCGHPATAERPQFRNLSAAVRFLIPAAIAAGAARGDQHRPHDTWRRRHPRWGRSCRRCRSWRGHHLCRLRHYSDVNRKRQRKRLP